MSEEINYDEPEQPLQPIKKIDDEILDRFINTYGFKHEVKDTKKGEQRLNIASASIGDNIYIIRKDGKKYYFLSVSKKNFDNFRKSEKEGFTFKFIDFNTDYFKKNEQKFIKSLKENKMFDDIEVKDGTYEEFKDRTIQFFTKYNTADRIKDIDPMKIPDIQPEHVQEKKDEEELMGDDDEEEEEEERMIDDEEEEEKERMIDDEEEERPINEEEEEEQRKEIEEKKRKMKEEEDKEYEKQKKVLFNDDYQNGLYDYDSKQKKSKSKKRSGVMKKEDRDVFDQLTEDLGFKKLTGNTAKTYLRVGDDVIFIKKTPEKRKNSIKDNPYLAVKLNKKDFQKLYNKKDVDDIEAEYFNFNTDYFNENKDKFKEAIKKGEFIFDDEIKKIKDETKKRTGKEDKLTYEDLMSYDIFPGKRNFDYVKIFDLKNGKIAKERGYNGQQLIKFSKDGKNITVNLPNKYLSNGYPDSLLKLIVGVSENNKGEVDFKEIGEIQDLNGDITNLYSDMQDLKSKINSSNNAEEKERLLIKYNKKRLKLEDLIKKYSKEAYRLSTLKKKKATMATHKYLMNKLNKLETKNSN